jgi:hypothetical protein
MERYKQWNNDVLEEKPVKTTTKPKWTGLESIAGFLLGRPRPNSWNQGVDVSLHPLCDGFGGLVVSMLASGSRVRGFDWIFSDVKKSSACLPSEGK